MQMDIYAHPFKLTVALEQYVAERIERAIGASSKSVQGVMVRLTDMHGERGGVNKACRIVAWLRKGGTAVVDAIDRDLYTAIDAASVKLHAAIGRRLHRRRTLRREHANRRFVYPFDERRPQMSAWSF